MPSAPVRKPLMLRPGRKGSAACLGAMDDLDPVAERVLRDDQPGHPPLLGQRPVAARDRRCRPPPAAPRPHRAPRHRPPPSRRSGRRRWRRGVTTSRCRRSSMRKTSCAALRSASCRPRNCVPKPAQSCGRGRLDPDIAERLDRHRPLPSCSVGPHARPGCNADVKAADAAMFAGRIEVSGRSRATPAAPDASGAEPGRPMRGPGSWPCRRAALAAGTPSRSRNPRLPAAPPTCRPGPWNSAAWATAERAAPRPRVPALVTDREGVAGGIGTAGIARAVPDAPAAPAPSRAWPCRRRAPSITPPREPAGPRAPGRSRAARHRRRTARCRPAASAPPARSASRARSTASPGATLPCSRPVMRPSSMRCGVPSTVKAKAPAQSSADQRYSGAMPPSVPAKAAAGRQSAAAMPGRPSTLPVKTPSPPGAAEPQTKQSPVEWLNGLARNQRVAAAAWSRVGGAGGSRSSAASHASATRLPSASRACTAVPARTIPTGRSTGQPRRSVTSAGCDRAAPPSGRRHSRHCRFRLGRGNGPRSAPWSFRLGRGGGAGTLADDQQHGGLALGAVVVDALP